MKRAIVSALAVLAPVVLATLSCSDGSNPDQPCTGIPAGGCPLSHGVACDDPACDAVYACLPGNAWQLDHACPAHEGGIVHDASTEADTAPPSFDAAIDAPPGAFGGPGCGPLESPDCSLGFALSCPSGCCDCEDLFICQSGGWSAWGTCSLDGGIQQTN